MHPLVLTWARELPPWQSDAVRRMLTQPSLTADDERQVLELLKASHGFPSSLQPQPVKGPAPVALSYKQIRLRELHSLENVNALEPGQRLEFLSEGLTIVFGDNGSGKSGYARVVKNACRARETSDPVLTNVFTNPSGAPRAKFELTADGHTRPFTWPHPLNPASRIPHVAVFDSHTSSSYVAGEREVDFLPGGLDLFGRLVDLFRKLKPRIDKESEQLEAQPPPAILHHLNADTEAGRWLGSLSATTEPSALATWLTFPAELTKKLTETRRRLSELTAGDHAAKLEALRLQQSRVERYREQLAAARTSVSDERLQQIAALKAELSQVEQAITAAAGESFSGYLLGTGNEVWKQLFLAAERFAVDYAFKALPPDQATHCVLCQQPLDSDAHQRFQRFRKFVSQDLAQRRAQLQSQLDALISGLPVQPPLLDPDLLRSDLGPLADAVLAQHQAIVNRASSLTGDLPPDLAPQFARFATRLSTEAEALRQGLDPVLLDRLRREVKELEARERLAAHAADVRAHHENLRSRFRLQQCKAALSTNPITQAAKNVTGTVLSDRLGQALAEEVHSLADGRITVELQRAGKQGQAIHRIKLKHANGDAGVARVLSEGEQKVIGLASFFAELEVGDFTCAVFDDPVTSLDHAFQLRIARRIIAAGRTRQIIVFTHDIFFLNLLIEEAQDCQLPHAVRSVTRRDERIGFIGGEEDLPWHKLKVKDRLARLRNLIAEKRNMAGADHEAAARYLASQLRSAWERAVEEVLFADTILRYRRSIETKRLGEVELHLDDIETVNRAITRLSRYTEAHDSPSGYHAAPPSFEDLLLWVDELANFAQGVRKRKPADVKANKAGG